MRNFIVVLLSIGIIIPMNTVHASSTISGDSVLIESSGWRFAVDSGSDICEVVRSEVGSCIYLSFDESSRTHYVDTVNERVDLINVVDTNGDLMSTYSVSSGSNHREVVADHMGVSIDNTEWISGEIAPLTASYGYLSTVRVWFDTHIVVKNTDGVIIDSFLVNENTDHATAVAQRMDVSLDRVEWISGEYKDGEEAHAISNQNRIYEAHLIIR